MLPEYAITWPADTVSPTDDREGRVVRVRGREPAAVVDDDEVAVPAEPAGVDDPYRRRPRGRACPSRP